MISLGFCACSGSGSEDVASASADDAPDSGTSSHADDVAGDDDGAGSDDDGDDPAADDDAADPILTVDDDTSSNEPDAGASGSPAGDSDASVPGEVVPDGLGGGFVTVGETDAGVLEILCGSEPCACSDGIDNDEDGLADGADSECTGPFDHDEGTFATGVPGDNQDPKWQDCFFDGNSGAGDDGCRYHTDCLTGDAAPDDDSCTVVEQCRDFCAPLTPPGCDCFGCCEVPLPDGGSVHILVSDQCSLANIEDEQACQRCQPTDACNNECGECEICIGETLEDLPDSCFGDPPDGSGGNGGSGGGDGAGGSGGPGGSGGSSAGGPSENGGSSDPGDPPDEPPPNVCDGGAKACLESSECASGQYCALGCCKTFPAR